jgi:hypothetical protein
MKLGNQKRKLCVKMKIMEDGWEMAQEVNPTKRRICSGNESGARVD